MVVFFVALDKYFNGEKTKNTEDGNKGIIQLDVMSILMDVTIYVTVMEKYVYLTEYIISMHSENKLYHRKFSLP